MSLEANRRNFIAKSLETLAVTPLAFVAFDNTSRQTEYSSLDLENASLSKNNRVEQEELLFRYYDKITQLRYCMENLRDDYKKNYYKSKEEVSIGLNTEGVLVATTDTVYYWEVPSSISDKDLIEKYKNYSQKYTELYEYLMYEDLIDLNLLQKIGIKTLNGDTTATQVLSAFIYTGQIALLLGYEELAAMSIKPEKVSLDEYLDSTLETSQHTRRSIFKVFGALGGASLGCAINSSISRTLSKGEQKLSEVLEEANLTRDNLRGENIKKHFGESLQEFKAKLNFLISESEKSLQSSVIKKSTKTHFEFLKKTCEELTTTIEDIQNDPLIEQKLGFLCACAEVTGTLQKVNSRDQYLAHSRCILEALGVGAAMACIVGIGEATLVKN